MFFVSGSNTTGMVSSEQPTMDDALAKAAEFLHAGMAHVGILDRQGRNYTAKELDLLVEMERAELEVMKSRAATND